MANKLWAQQTAKSGEKTRKGFFDKLKELSRYRYETGKEALIDAKLMYDNHRYKNALRIAFKCLLNNPVRPQF